MTAERPPPLRNQPRYAEALRAFAAESPPTEMLERVEERLNRQLAEPAAAVRGASAKAPRVWLGVGALVIAGGAAAMLGRAMTTLEPAIDGAAPAAAAPAPPDEVAEAAPAAVSPAPTTPAVVAPRAGGGGMGPPPAAARRALQTSGPALSPSDGAAPEVASEPPSPSPRLSTLAAELGIFESAKRQAQAGRHDDALAQLDQLLAAYPATSLRPEADLLRADTLTRSGRSAEALTLVERLLGDPLVASRQAQLQRLRGELWRKRGDCSRAVEAWQRALELGLPAADEPPLRRAIAACQ